MSIAEKLQIIAENEQKVYDAGKSAERNEFWDIFQDYGKRTNYTMAFQRGWKDAIYNPKYPIHLKGNCVSTYNGTSITDTKVDIHAYGSNITHLIAAGAMKTVRKIILADETVTFSQWFYNSKALENITFEGTIYNNIDFSYSTKLTHESLMNIISCLLDDGANAENLLPYPYASTTNTDYNGITWTDNGDGSITVNGTAQFLDGIFSFVSSGNSFVLPAGSYTFSLGTDNTDFCINIEGTANGNNVIIANETNSALSFTLAEETTIDTLFIFPSGAPTFDNLVLRPSLTLATASGAAHTCVLGSTNLAKLSDTEKAIATEKGWTLA